MEAIRLANLQKSFAGKPALHGLSFSVERGEIFGLLGHNGAGKSTALGILLGMVFPDAGEAFVGGISVQRERARALAKVGANISLACGREMSIAPGGLLMTPRRRPRSKT